MIRRRDGDESENVSSRTETILSAVLEALAQRRLPDERVLRAQCPGHETTIDRFFSAAATYLSWSRTLAPHTDDKPLPSGTILGDFVIESYLQCGGMGAVYRARQLSLGNRAVALKVVWIQRNDERQLVRFRREALLTASLHHPNLAEIYGFGVTEDLCFYAMRLVQGPTLHDLLKGWMKTQATRKTRSWQRWLVRRLSEVASALALVHRSGLVHRDVKPANIILEGRDGGGIEERAVLVDFGLVRSTIEPQAVQTTAAIATRAYAAPEQLLGHTVTPRADVFALGVTLHDLLAGRLPEDRAQASAGLEPLNSLVPEINRNLAAIVAKATDLDPSRRYGDAALLERDWRAWLEGRAVSARSSKAFEQVQRWVRRHPWKVVMAGLIVILLAGSVRFLMAQADLAGAATRASEGGDIATLCESLQEMCDPLRSLFIVDEPLQDLVEALQRDLDHPVLRVRDYMRSGVAQEAMLAAAAGGRQGLMKVPLLERFFCRVLRESVSNGPRARLERALRSVAFPVTARLFHEAPDRTAEDLESLVELHTLLRRLLQEGITGEEALCVVSALSACGTPEVVNDLLDWMRSNWNDLEPRRLGLMSIEYILRRSRHTGTSRSLSPQVFARLQGLYTQVMSDRDPLWRAISIECACFVRALAFFARSQGQTIDAKPLLENDKFCIDDRLDLLAALGLDPISLTSVEARSHQPGMDPEADLDSFLALIESWGWRHAVLENNPDAQKTILDHCSDLAAERHILPQTEDVWFDAGKKRGSSELLGILTEFEPENRSLLTCMCGPAMSATMAAYQGAAPAGNELAVWEFTTPRMARVLGLGDRPQNPGRQRL
ncbi:MAG: serine/threonine-protein kinase [Planctomycetota bacterium]